MIINANDSGIIGTPEHDPERDIDNLLSVLEQLSDAKDHPLQQVDTFNFNIGWQSSSKRPEGSFTLTDNRNLLRRIAKFNASLAVTIYPSEENDDCEK